MVWPDRYERSALTFELPAQAILPEQQFGFHMFAANRHDNRSVQFSSRRDRAE